MLLHWGDGEDWGRVAYTALLPLIGKVKHNENRKLNSLVIPGKLTKRSKAQCLLRKYSYNSFKRNFVYNLVYIIHTDFYFVLKKRFKEIF